MNKLIALTAGLFIPFLIRPTLINNGVGAEVIIPMLVGAIICGGCLFALITKETEVQ